MRQEGFGGGAANGRDDPQYEGATLINLEKVYYLDSIYTLDFALRYPPIIMAHNLSSSSLVRQCHLILMKDDDVSNTPAGALFAKNNVNRGIITEMLE